MKIVILSTAENDLAEGHRFYERQEAGAGDYFLRTLFVEIDSLLLFAGTHRKVFGKYRLLSRTFPFAVFYTISGESIEVRAVLDQRRHPSWIRLQLRRN